MADTKHEDWRADVVPRVRWMVRVNAGEIPPDGYGLAAYDYSRDSAFYMPIPLNVLYACWRRVKSWLQCNPIARHTREANAYRDGYMDGVRSGDARGYARGFEDGTRRLYEGLQREISRLAVPNRSFME